VHFLYWEIQVPQVFDDDNDGDDNDGDAASAAADNNNNNNNNINNNSQLIYSSPCKYQVTWKRRAL
jgi:hypothetical protein